ncbi:kynurenine formamidase isoform X2 [Periplaneta americana]|uniref:kynurenine formamidase isoform X2 n=1 Tax=Periplaneta americana TaxID=6978 RepID=UPI0037E8AF36
MKLVGYLSQLIIMKLRTYRSEKLKLNSPTTNGFQTMDQTQLEHQYSPSRWSHRFQDPDDVIQNHIDFITKASEDARTRIPVQCGVRYGPKAEQQLDVFGGQSLPDDASILVYIHGGYWQELSRCTSAYCVEPQYRNGVRTVILGYDLAPTVTLREIVEEIKTGAEYVVNMAVNFGARSVWFAGHSAGAHLVSMLLFSGWLNQLDDRRRNLVKGLVLISGVYDLTPLINTYVNDNLKLSREEARVLSPMLLNIESLSVRKLTILVAVAEFDSPEFQRQSQTFFEKLEQKSTMLEFITVPGVDHFDIVENLHKEDFVLTKKITELIARD